MHNGPHRSFQPAHLFCFVPYKAGSRAVEPFIPYAVLGCSGPLCSSESHCSNLTWSLCWSCIAQTYYFHHFFPCWFWGSALQVPWLFRTELGLQLTDQNIVCWGAELLTLPLEQSKVSQLSALLHSGPFVLSGHVTQFTPNHTESNLHHRNWESAKLPYLILWPHNNLGFNRNT